MDHIFQSYPEDARRIGEEYLSSLTDLNCNSKPLINMLTMLAEENINYAHVIVRVVEYHISQVPPEFKLPILYLIDSIIKNVKSSYVQLFGQCIVNIFLNAFESVQHSPSQVLEKVRERMYLLRQTWNDVFPPSKMYALDVKVKRLDNNWPITAKPSQPNKIHVNPAIHVNPDFLKTGMVPMPVNSALPGDMEEILQAKTRELLELKKRKLELELEQTKMHLKEQERQLSQAADAIAVAPIGMPAPVSVLRPPGMETVIPPTVAPPMYPSGMRHVRPMAPVASGGMIPIIGQPAFANKPKVHPVNPAMLNSVRPRDPRLARQMQPQQSAQMAAPMRALDSRLESHKAPAPSSSSTTTHKSSRSRSKSPLRNTGSNRSSKLSSSSNHHSSSSNRKRSESKSSTASTSSSGSDGRHKGGNSSSVSPVKRSSSSRDKHSGKEHNERNAHNGGSPASSKRKSSSPASSPAKSKRNATHKTISGRSKSGGSSNARSRSRSPIYLDVDMRSVERSKSPEPAKSTPAVTVAQAAAVDATATTATAAANAVIANDLEKPTMLTAAAATTTTTAAAPATVASNATSVRQSSPAPASSESLGKQLSQGAGEKRSAGQLPPDGDTDEEDKQQQPQQKRSKSTKLDALFGSEDVDLRRELPVKPNTIVPGGVIVVEDDSMDNWEANKQTVKQPSSPVKKPTLDELRAKLAKTVRHNNKLSKEKSKEHPMAQRLKQLSELKVNDDSQEAHDEKMRTILSQAQEMFENHGMNQEQYKELVSKVVVMSESSKLKEKRREAADDEDIERNAARDAVLRKRIPKLKGNENHASSSPRSDSEPRYEEQLMPAQAMPEKPQQPPKQKNKRDGKRRKPSKWGEQVDPAAAQRAAWQLAQNNNNNNNNKRMTGANVSAGGGGGGGFRGMPWQHPPLVMTQTAVPPPPQPPSMLSLPPVPPVSITKAINSLDNPMADVVRSITIDGGSKEIRFYNQVAIIFMDGDEPHEIGFQHGQRAIYIDHNEPLALSFNDDYKPFQLDGQLHRIRFGHPSRELYIDEHWYEIYFGGPPVSLPIGNKLHVLKAEGPPPNVDIGRVRRDLVVGKINMIVDAHTIVPLFLDGRQQTFHLGAEQHSLQFVDSFLYALLDGQLQKLEYGGLPKSMKLNGGRNCFIRFGTLPKGVQAGKAHVQDMVYIKTEAPAEPPQPPPLPVPVIAAAAPPAVPTLEQPAAAPAATTTTPAPAVPLPVAAAALGNLNIDELFQKLVSSGIIGGAATSAVASSSGAVNVPAVETSSSSSKDAAAAAPAAPPTEPIKRIELHKPETIKTRQSAVIATLYLGMQCSSCGVRFPPEQTIKYSQHLDWHFRQNRRERDSTRKATSRRWFYDLNDWRQYEEIEDVEERERNFLEAQGQQLGPDAIDEVSQQRSLDSPVPSCAAGTDDLDRSCDMCHEKFEQFYNEELEEWHLRSAIRVDEKIYHPLCYEDYKASLNPPAAVVNDSTTNGDMDMLNASDDNAMDTLIKVEDDSDDAKKTSTMLLDDDDDDVIVLPNEEPSVTEIVDDDDDEYVPMAVTAEPETEAPSEKPTTSATSGEQEQKKEQQKDEEQQQRAENANESDVEIQEPNIPFTDLDTYVEKEPMPMLNVKIKEEPKDDDEEDEDDGFEDVGTVVQLVPLPEDEISILSSETQTQTIDSTASPATMERPASVTSLSMTANEDDLELEPSAAMAGNSEADFNGENPQETHNLSAAGPAPALPLASIVNKIKINITKNTSSNSHNSASTTTTTSAAATAAATDSQVSAISVIGATGNADVHQQQNSIQTISTIPVLCGGNTFVPKIATSSSTCLNAPPANISSISVIGSSYGSSSSSNNNNNNVNSRLPTLAATTTTTTTTTTAATSLGAPAAATGSSGGGGGPATTAAAQKSITPPPAAVEAEPEPVIELKPALRQVTLKKTKKVQNGVETSGLCSIM
ncbi:pre-mRNA cleavage complex 2 protein Pcf11 [Drosophila novamexicana]|uniref:pre-mRNA cleavage complex 2 protein Pcf11 n=1 Tax=Drosophila novamexicana TaxID=47314 RepID=UPI0011E5B2A4|nr:pre-mRNA cleavage complex 2 protein Pcf11 [Drosophila novamexicana]